MKEQNELMELRSRVVALEERNARVELNKAWETSGTRKLAIVVVTYFIVLAFLLIIKNDKPFINAIVPSLGFFLSTLAVGRLREHWVRRQH